MHLNRNLRRVFLHLVFWLAAGLVWYYLRYQDYRSTGAAITVTIIKIIDLAFLVYLANYLLIPRLLYRKKYLVFTFLFISIIALSSFYKMYLIGSLTNNHELLNFTSENLKRRIYDNFIPHFFLVIAGVAFKLLIDFTRVQKRLSEVAKEKAEAELNFLKSQMNPHFLFNSLNSVYFLIDKNNTEARDALHKFSEMLRYQLYEIGGKKVRIENEIGYLKDYISLQQLRRENCQVNLEVQEDMTSFSIEPLLLIPFVENSFKHLSHYAGEKNEIDIRLYRYNGEMVFDIKNTTEGGVKEIERPQGGIGLTNVKRRLELLYPGKHVLNINKEKGWFGVQLKIKMDQ